MLLVRDLTKLAWFRGVDPFVRFMGPIALMQELATESAARHDETVPIPSLNADNLPKLGPLGALGVALLPEPSATGALQLVVGRDPACQLVLDHPWVSANHAAIRWDGKQAMVVDLASANGTFVNKKKIDRQSKLGSGDLLSFGRSSCIYLLSADLHARLRRYKPED